LLHHIKSFLFTFFIYHSSCFFTARTHKFGRQNQGGPSESDDENGYNDYGVSKFYSQSLRFSTQRIIYIHIHFFYVFKNILRIHLFSVTGNQNSCYGAGSYINDDEDDEDDDDYDDDEDDDEDAEDESSSEEEKKDSKMQQAQSNSKNKTNV